MRTKGIDTGWTRKYIQRNRTKQGRFLVADAWNLQEDANGTISHGRLRNAAETAWCATKRATDALVLERIGREPQNERDTSLEVAYIGQESPSLDAFRSTFVSQMHDLHGYCYIDGHCEPEGHHAEMIGNSNSHIREAERLAG